jgi:hypothetical protein
MSDFAILAVRAIRFMEQNRRGLGVGGPITIRYMGYDSEWDANPSDDEINDFEKSARKYLRDFNGRKNSMIQKSRRELMKQKRS